MVPINKKSNIADQSVKLNLLDQIKFKIIYFLFGASLLSLYVFINSLVHVISILAPV